MKLRRFESTAQHGSAGRAIVEEGHAVFEARVR
jgi:hypothetical protein